MGERERLKKDIMLEKKIGREKDKEKMLKIVEEDKKKIEKDV